MGEGDGASGDEVLAFFGGAGRRRVRIGVFAGVGMKEREGGLAFVDEH